MNWCRDRIGLGGMSARPGLPGSDGAAHSLLQRFLARFVEAYGHRRATGRACPGTSRLSPHLHFGEIGPREMWHECETLRAGAAAGTRTLARIPIPHRDWLARVRLPSALPFPADTRSPLRANFAQFPWKPRPARLQAWQRGGTGYPLVDAGMRQLWRTGWMHNRVRMIAASFLVKDLLQPWNDGRRWFWDTLVDADLASNTLGWQWVAGCGADAAPYFRIFNPTTQATRFDPQGTYVREWVPELARLPDEWIHQPWAAPNQVSARLPECTWGRVIRSAWLNTKRRVPKRLRRWRH